MGSSLLVLRFDEKIIGRIQSDLVGSGRNDSERLGLLASADATLRATFGWLSRSARLLASTDASGASTSWRFSARSGRSPRNKRDYLKGLIRFDWV